jgi:hypothetical protein|tara:strand:+ start:221 stop:862 length:642 start_codon:yes stop_codon:yes gene_type:complete
LVIGPAGDDGGGPVATYSATEIANGMGTATYYLAGKTDTDGVDYTITSVNVHSHPRVINESSVTTTTFTFYSGAFNRARTMNGTQLFNFHIGVNGAGGTSGQITIKLYHYDGSTSTQIGSTWTGATLSASTGTGKQHRSEVAEITATNQKFKRGDQIKIEVALIVVGSGGYVEVGIDPQNRDSSDATNGLEPSTNKLVSTKFIYTASFRSDYD